MTYDPTRGGTRKRLTRSLTVAFTQDGITGRVAKTNFGSGSYDVGEGDQARSVAWNHCSIDGEPLTRIRIHYSRGRIREIELPRQSRPEMDGFDGEPNFTGRSHISRRPENANVV